ncbi:hypothetical protein BD410DRAFT_382711 [Rickenella mellea]|uniref:Uncharacterized protein n=1 Tax=Rickenella mellea TaxID=50990 RepID=A0A4Y7PZ20_9AGAM|nr:hypothetical protein BD410DRAFT_382711 [Rickenella mellea]
MSTFPFLEVLRLGHVPYLSAPFTPWTTTNHLHTLHGGMMLICGQFRYVPLPALSVIHLHLDPHLPAHFAPNGILALEPLVVDFFTAHGKAIKKIVSRGVLTFFMKFLGHCDNLHDLMFEIHDDLALEPTDMLNLPQVKRIGILPRAQHSARPIVSDDIRPQWFRSYFPAVKVVRLMDKRMFRSEKESILRDWKNGMTHHGTRLEYPDGNEVSLATTEPTNDQRRYVQ